MQKLFYVSSQKRTFIMDDHSQNIGKSSSWAQENKSPKQDSQHRLRSHMPEEDVN